MITSENLETLNIQTTITIQSIKEGYSEKNSELT